jgi:hypothetical protein
MRIRNTANQATAAIGYQKDQHTEIAPPCKHPEGLELSCSNRGQGTDYFVPLAGGTILMADGAEFF